MNNSVITCDEIIDVEAKSDGEETQTLLTKFNEKKVVWKTQNLYIFLPFLLVAIALLTVVSIYCYLIKFWAKQKLKTNSKKLFINNINQKQALNSKI